MCGSVGIGVTMPTLTSGGRYSVQRSIAMHTFSQYRLCRDVMIVG